MLPVLREAGVVDAGAAGLVEIVRGIAAALAGEPLPRGARADRRGLGVEAIHQELSRYRYCTVFVVEGDAARRRRARARARAARRLAARRRRPDRAEGARPHGRPGPRALARRRARDDRRRRDREHARADARARGAAAARGARRARSDAVRRRRGRRRATATAALFESLGARVVDGGRTMNPSTADLLAAIEASAARRGRSCCRTTGTSSWPPSRRPSTRRSPCASSPTRSLQAGLAALRRVRPDARRRRERGER